MKTNKRQLTKPDATASGFTLPQVAASLNCCRRFLELQIKAGHLKVVRLSSRCVRIRPADLADYLERRAV